MIHLFNNVTFKDSSFFEVNNPNSVYVKNDFDKEIYGRIKGYSTKNFSLKKFIEDSGNQRRVAYCDFDAMVKIIPLFFKSTLSLDENAFIELIKTYEHRLKHYNTNDEDLIQGLIDAWSKTKVVALPKVTQSFEILLANAFIDPDSVKSTLNPILSAFMLRQHKNIINEAKDIISKNITSKGIQKLMGNSGDPLPITEIDKLNWDIFNSEEVNKTTMDWADSVFAIAEPGAPSPSLGWPYVDELVKGKLSAESYKKVIEEIKSAEVGIPYIPEDLEETINTQFIGYARDCSPETLEKYKIKK